MTIRLWALGMEMATLALWLHLILHAKYQWEVKDDRFPFKLAASVIVLFALSFLVTTFTGLTSRRPVSAGTYTPLVACVIGIVTGGALAIVFYAKRISSRHHAPAWHPERQESGVRR